ncbi:MAG: NAD(P)H-binding protein [Betaproteobacteria bacterium]
MAKSRIALVAGATGLTGKHLLELLLADTRYARVHALVRKAALPSHPKLSEHVIDFAALGKLPKADEAFCCLGTTIKKAGSQAQFRKVDFDCVVNFASAAKAAGANRFLVVSALGANAKSAVFYNRVKGEMEAALSAMNFESLHIFRPSLLLGERAEARVGERLGIAVFTALAPLMIGPARRVRPVEAKAVAQGMMVAANADGLGIWVTESDEIVGSTE